MKLTSPSLPEHFSVLPRSARKCSGRDGEARGSIERAGEYLERAGKYMYLEGVARRAIVRPKAELRSFLTQHECFSN